MVIPLFISSGRVIVCVRYGINYTQKQCLGCKKNNMDLHEQTSLAEKQQASMSLANVFGCRRLQLNNDCLPLSLEAAPKQKCFCLHHGRNFLLLKSVVWAELKSRKHLRTDWQQTLMFDAVLQQLLVMMGIFITGTALDVQIQCQERTLL